ARRPPADASGWLFPYRACNPEDGGPWHRPAWSRLWSRLRHLRPGRLTCGETAMARDEGYPTAGRSVTAVRRLWALDVRAKRGELALEVLVPAADQVDPEHPRRTLGGQCRDQVAEAGPQVGDDQVGRVQLARPGDHRRVQEVAPAEAARGAAEAFPVHLDRRTHGVQRLGVTQAPLVHGLMHDRQPMRLGQ